MTTGHNAPKAVIFDLDGTIADTLPLCIEAFRRAIEPAAGRHLSDGEIIATFGPSEEGTIMKLAPDSYGQCLEAYIKCYAELHDSMCPAPFSGIREIIEQLRDSGTITAMVTGKGRRSCEITLRKYGMDNSFLHVGCGSPEGDVKAERIAEVLARFGLEPHEAVYVGDSPSDIAACRRCGVGIISAAWAATADPVRLASLGPDRMFFSVEDFSDYILG